MNEYWRGWGDRLWIHLLQINDPRNAVTLCLDLEIENLLPLIRFIDLRFVQSVLVVVGGDVDYILVDCPSFDADLISFLVQSSGFCHTKLDRGKKYPHPQTFRSAVHAYFVRRDP